MSTRLRGPQCHSVGPPTTQAGDVLDVTRQSTDTLFMPFAWTGRDSPCICGRRRHTMVSLRHCLPACSGTLGPSGCTWPTLPGYGLRPGISRTRSKPPFLQGNLSPLQLPLCLPACMKCQCLSHLISDLQYTFAWVARADEQSCSKLLHVQPLLGTSNLFRMMSPRSLRQMPISSSLQLQL